MIGIKINKTLRNVLIALAVIILFLFMSKQFIRGLTAGAVKG